MLTKEEVDRLWEEFREAEKRENEAMWAAREAYAKWSRAEAEVYEDDS